VTVKFQVGKVVAPAATGKNPESNPVTPLALSLRQGSSKADWVTVWFFSWLLVNEHKHLSLLRINGVTHNSKTTVSRGAALMKGGSKASLPGPPTMTL